MMKEEQVIETKTVDLIQQYKQRFLDIPLDKSGADELYKWELITDCQGKTGIDIINRIRESNIVDVPRINKVLKDLNVDHGQELADAFNVLSDESVDL